MYGINFNAQAVFDQLARARGKLADMTPLYEDIADYVVDATRGRFLTSTAPDGSRWREKSPATLAAYLRRGNGDRPFPLIGPSERLRKEIAKLVTRDSAEIGSVVEYSAVMQDGAAKGAFGTTRTGRPIPWGDIPARPFIGLSGENERGILDIADEHLEDVFEP